MKKYHFGYHEFITKYKFIEVYLDSSIDPQSMADSMTAIDELISWEEQSSVTNESEIQFVEIDSDNHCD